MIGQVFLNQIFLEASNGNFIFKIAIEVHGVQLLFNEDRIKTEEKLDQDAKRLLKILQDLDVSNIRFIHRFE